MIVKVCGITDTDQYKWLNSHGIDMIGLNFYPESKRYIEKLILDVTASKSKKVGVFVNPGHDLIRTKCSEYALDLVQLHGNESSQFCRIVTKDVPVIKAFGIDDKFNFDELEPYLDSVSYFLFDTKSTTYGGSGRKFNWRKLNEYKHDKPFILSGGITLEDIPQILQLKNSKLAGIDVNSGFEVNPGIKDIEKIDMMMKLIGNEKS